MSLKVVIMNHCAMFFAPVMAITPMRKNMVCEIIAAAVVPLAEKRRRELPRAQ